MSWLEWAFVVYAVIAIFVAWRTYSELARWADVGRTMNGTRKTGMLWLLVAAAAAFWPLSIWVLGAKR